MASDNSDYQEIPLEAIDVPHHREREGEKFTQLTLNLKTQGLLHPIKVKAEAGGRYTLIFGEGRLRAANELGWGKIFAQVVDSATDQEVLVEWLTENLQRVDMSPKDKALNIARLIEHFGYSIRKVSDHLGLSESYVRGLYAVMKDGSVRLRNALNKKMAVTATQIAAKFKNKAVQNEFLDTFKKEKVKKQSQQRALVKAVPRGISDINASLAQIRRQLKDYRGLVDIAENRLDLLAPGLKKLKKDPKFVNKMKIYKIPFTWSGA